MDKSEVYRDLIRHENELTNHRLSWFILMQAVLFAGLGTMWGKDVTPLLILSAVGFVVCIPFGYVLSLNDAAISSLLARWSKDCDNQESHPPLIGFDKAKFVWLLPWNSVPYIFGCTWIGILWLLCTRYQVGT
ncbi:MAG: hypothetical protein HOF76_03225 [Candidatus Scalindua sp.]|nr:hypothetical protein [Candidatus Scalindua sp.]